jgi:hypothetical protein
MQVECTRQIDASELNELGFYEYYYEYDLYRFTDGSICFIARSYVDEPEEAHFLCIEEEGRRRILVKADLKHPLFVAAQAHLRTVGKTQVRWLGGKDGFESLPPHSILEA